MDFEDILEKTLWAGAIGTFSLAMAFAGAIVIDRYGRTPQKINCATSSDIEHADKAGKSTDCYDDAAAATLMILQMQAVAPR